VSTPPASEDLVELPGGEEFPAYLVAYAEGGPGEAVRFLNRMPRWFDPRDTAVLDVGCGTGALCVELARRGANRVVGVDVAAEAVRLAHARLAASDRPEPIAYRVYGGDPAELAGERFDIVVCKDSFHRFVGPGRPGPEAIFARMACLLRDGGLLAIGFAPLWRAPYGGQIESRMPWAHLIFPESFIFEKYRRDRPPGRTARTFEEGFGLNRMTLARFRRIADASGMECLHLATNVSDRRTVRAMRVLARLPVLEEYTTQNVYGIWRRPPGWRPAGRRGADDGDR
jgi:SAM-dependent methyltransferase